MNQKDKQRLISLAAMTGRLEGSADSLDLVIDNADEDYRHIDSTPGPSG